MKNPQIVFEAFCPGLNRTVILLRGIWFFKILGDAGHPELRGKEGLVQRVIQKAGSDDIWIDRAHPAHKPYIQVSVSDFLPYNKFLRVALAIKDDKTAVVTTALAKNSFTKGVVKYVESYR